MKCMLFLGDHAEGELILLKLQKNQTGIMNEVLKMKRIVLCFLIFALTCCCSSCDEDPYEGKRPVDYAYSSWECAEYNVFFSVEENRKLKDAKILINEQWYDFEFLWYQFDNRVRICFEIDGEEHSFLGYCDFGKNQFTIEIDDTEGYYPEEQITMVFVRTE